MAKVVLTTITSGYATVDALNANFAAIAAAIENTFSRDGTSPNTFTADLDMNSRNIINLADPVDPQDAVTLAYLEANFSEIDNSNFVALTGNQTIGGVKTFSSQPVLPGSPTSDLEAATKAYVDLARYPVQNAQLTHYTLVLGDNGKHIYSENTGAQTITIPSNAQVAFPLGTIITVVNNGNSVMTIDATTNSITLKTAGTTDTGDAALAVQGMCTLLKVGTNTWFVSGAGLS